MKVFANRASALLYNYLKTKGFTKPFLLPSNVCPVVPLTFLKAGLDFEFVDIDDNHAINKSVCLEKLSTGMYDGLLFVHAYGREYNNDEFYNSIKSFNPNLNIIDDKCLCVPNTLDTKLTNIDFQLFSTGYAKYVELSFGGFANVCSSYEAPQSDIEYSKNVEIQQQIYIKQCLNKGIRYEWSPDVQWLDCSDLKMTFKEYLNLIDRKKIEVAQNKSVINSIYRENLPKSIQMGEDYENWRFCILVNNQSRLLDEIFKNNLFAGTNFPSISYMFKGVHSEKADYDSSRIVNLFNDFRISEEQAFRICELIVKYYE